MPADPDGGFGYRVLGQAGDFSRGEADAAWIGPHARLDGAGLGR